MLKKASFQLQQLAKRAATEYVQAAKYVLNRKV